MTQAIRTIPCMPCQKEKEEGKKETMARDPPLTKYCLYASYETNAQISHRVMGL